MISARSLALIKRAAAIVLLLCFVLPLSKCDGQIDPASGLQGADTINYGFSLLLEFAHDTLTSPWQAIAGMLAVIAVFIGPFCTLFLRKAWEPLLSLCGAVLAWNALGVWVFMLGHPMAGGWLASACWIVIAIVSALELWDYRKRHPAPLV
ncbi:MAG TPA: hypothetical protein VFS95_02270 [Telluria sp.]|nr:hypothetical protein [Telluria sp.]